VVIRFQKDRGMGPKKLRTLHPKFQNAIRGVISKKYKSEDITRGVIIHIQQKENRTLDPLLQEGGLVMV